MHQWKVVLETQDKAKKSMINDRRLFPTGLFPIDVGNKWRLWLLLSVSCQSYLIEEQTVQLLTFLLNKNIYDSHQSLLSASASTKIHCLHSVSVTFQLSLLWGRVFANIDMFEKVCKIQRTFLFIVLPLPGLVVMCTALIIVNCMIWCVLLNTGEY